MKCQICGYSFDYARRIWRPQPSGSYGPVEIAYVLLMARITETTEIPLEQLGETEAPLPTYTPVDSLLCYLAPPPSYESVLETAAPA